MDQYIYDTCLHRYIVAHVGSMLHFTLQNHSLCHICLLKMYLIRGLSRSCPNGVGITWNVN